MAVNSITAIGNLGLSGRRKPQTVRKSVELNGSRGFKSLRPHHSFSPSVEPGNGGTHVPHRHPRMPPGRGGCLPACCGRSRRCGGPPCCFQQRCDIFPDGPASRDLDLRGRCVPPPNVL